MYATRELCVCVCLCMSHACLCARCTNAREQPLVVVLRHHAHLTLAAPPPFPLSGTPRHPSCRAWLSNISAAALRGCWRSSEWSGAGWSAVTASREQLELLQLGLAHKYSLLGVLAQLSYGAVAPGGSSAAGSRGKELLQLWFCLGSWCSSRQPAVLWWEWWLVFGGCSSCFRAAGNAPRRRGTSDA